MSDKDRSRGEVVKYRRTISTLKLLFSVALHYSCSNLHLFVLHIDLNEVVQKELI